MKTTNPLAETEQKLARALAEVQSLHHLLESIVENIPDMIFVKEAKTRQFVLFNRAGEELLGWRREDLIGRTDGDFFPPEQAEFFWNKDSETLANGGVLEVSDERLNTRDKGVRILHTRKVPLYEGGEPAYLLGISEDVTARRDAESALAQLREAFAAAVVHDLRTPIQAILLHCEVLALDARARAGEGEGPVASIDAIQRNASQLKLLTSDLLDATRIELRSLPLALASIDVPAAVSALLERIRPSLGRHPVTVDVVGPPPRARLDPVRLDQILTNVVENAARYSPETAPIHVRIAADGSGVTVSVSDRGSGIAPEDLARIFNRFYRARLGHGGLGLGLYITKELVEAHGGRIAVDSPPGEGSTFQIWFPAEVLERTDAVLQQQIQ